MRLTHALHRALTIGADRTATIDGTRRRTWREVADRVARMAAGLKGLGIDRGDRVAILAHNCDTYLEAYFACLWAGAAMVPLNTRLALPELDFQLRDASPKVLLHGAEFAALAARLMADGAVPTIVAFDRTDEGASLDGWCDTCAPIAAATGPDGDLAAIFYTGGTTGLPKGVMLSHANLQAMVTNLLMVIPFDEECVSFHTAPMFHLADIATLMATIMGGTHVFQKSYDAEAMLEAVSRHGVTHCFTVPAMIERMTQAERGGRDLSSLRVLGYGGSSMPAASLERAREAFVGVDFVQGFGQTEFPAATFLSPRDHRPGAPVERLRSCGRACPEYEIRIVDPEGREVPRGTIGEIVGRGGNVMMGYWNRPEETAEVLRDGWIHTRDGGSMDEQGYVYITDRLKDMIVSGAENIYSIEVENALSWHPAVAESAVIGLADPVWGERVHAVIVLKPDAPPPTLRDVGDFCRTRIAGYKVPKSLTIRDRPLPRSAAGKILKGPIREEEL